MAKKQVIQPLIRRDIEQLLDGQTTTILNAVDEKIGRVDKHIDTLEKSIDAKLSITEIRILAAVDKKILASEERINRKLDKLITTLDKFLKRLTDLEDEFTIMKHDLNRLKEVVRDKLGVDLL